jgi:RND superfamily putative drug exporter
MDRLAGFVRRRRKLVLVAWVVVLLASIPFASRQTENLTSGGFEVPGTQSAAVDEANDRFPGVDQEPLGVVLEQRGGDAAAMAAAVARVAEAADGAENVEVTGEALAAAEAAAAKEPVVLVPLDPSGTRDDVLEASKDLREELSVGEPVDGVQAYVVGQQALWAGLQEVQKEDLERAEMTGFPLILIVLLAVFGSVLAALLPVGLGVAAVIVTGAAVYFLALAMTMSVFVTNMASLLGIGVSVDYSLFLLARYRDEIHAGRDRAEALDIAMRTSGATVVFSGMTVVVSVAGLFLLNAAVLRSLAIGAIVVVLIAILGAVTLLPALIALLGRRADEPGRVVSATGLLIKRLSGRANRPPRPGPGFWERWTTRLMRRPLVFALLGTAIMLALAVPALSLEFNNGALAQFGEANETRRGAELAGSQASPGESAPLLMLADFHEGGASGGDNQAALQRYADQLSGTEGIAEVRGPAVSEDGEAALLTVILDVNPESEAGLAEIDELRAEGGAGSGLADLASVSVGGATAQTVDFAGLVSGGIWKLMLFVLLCSYLILLVVLRSVLLPLKAVIMNLLTVGAAYGVLVAVFQFGWFDSILNYDSLGYVNAITPPLLLAIVFGLSMDYEVFLLSRIRERYFATGDNRRGVAEGLQHSAKVITSAALIMVVVFGTFALTGIPQIKEIGLGLAVAIALDATIVRLVLVPTTMELMGKWNWWLPGWLDRVLPRADFESDVELDRQEEDRAPAAV